MSTPINSFIEMLSFMAANNCRMNCWSKPTPLGNNLNIRINTPAGVYRKELFTCTDYSTPKLLLELDVDLLDWFNVIAKKVQEGK